MGKKYGYARVSTTGQDLETQRLALLAEGIDEADIMEEKRTGTKLDARPKFVELIEKVQAGDTIVVTKLDRFARSVIDAIQTIKELFDKGVKVHVLNMGLVENTPTGKLIFNIMSSFAEFERDLIVERTQAGKALAKQNPNFTEGRPPVYKKSQKELAIELLKTHSYKQVEEMTGMSKSTLIRAKKKALG
jgi:DNA invertase Pin-like site-specific DNA recombinase